MKARRQIRKIAHGQPMAERQEQWVGLAIVATRGLPGYPPPRNTNAHGSSQASRLILDKAIVDHAFSFGEA